MEEEESEKNMGNVDDSEAEWSNCNSDVEEEDDVNKGEPARGKDKASQVPAEDEDENRLKIDLDATPSTSSIAKRICTPKLRVMKSGLRRKGKLPRAHKARARGTLATPIGCKSVKRRRKKRQTIPKLVVDTATATDKYNRNLGADIKVSAAKLGLNRTQVTQVRPDLLSVFMEKAGEFVAEGARMADRFDGVLEKIKAMKTKRSRNWLEFMTPKDLNALMKRRSIPKELPSPSYIAERKQAFLDSLGMVQQMEDEDGFGAYIKELDMYDRDLILMPNKELYAFMRQKNIPEEMQKQIKARRRTLKNRGYATNCRLKRDDKEKELLEQIESHKRRLHELDEEEWLIRMEKQEFEARERQDREWEATIEEYKDYIKPGELDGLLKLPSFRDRSEKSHSSLEF